MKFEIGRLYVMMFFAVLSADNCHAKDIFGKVVNSHGSPLEYANIALLSRNDSAFVKGEMTDSVGAFVFEHLDGSGEWLLKVSMLGYQDTCLVFSQSPCVIQLKESHYSLKEVVVKGNVFRQTSTGIKTMVAGTSLGNLSSADEVLAHVPGLFKGSQGDYQIAGKGTPVFYLNGRRVYNSNDIENLSPDMIKDIEVVRNPGVSYGADIKSVVLITTKRKQGDGLGMYLRSSYYGWTNSDFVEQVNWNYRHRNLDVFGNHSFVSQDTEVHSEITQILHSDRMWEQRNFQKSQIYARVFKNTFGANYNFDDKNSAGIKYSVDFPLNTIDTSVMESFVDVDGKPYDELGNLNESRNTSPARHHANAYYRGHYGKFTFGTDLDFLRNKRSSSTIYSEQSDNYQDRIVNTESNVTNMMFASKVFSELSLAKWSLVLGLDYSRTHRESDYRNAEQIVSSNNEEAREKHLAPYMDMRWSVGNCQVSGGLRYEMAWVNYMSEDHSVLDRSYRNVYPNISVYLLLKNVGILAGYSIKDRKPSYSMLRNEVTYGNRFTYQTGNPYLESEKIHEISLSVVYKWMQFALGYTDRRDAILYSSDFYEEDRSIALISFDNIPSLKSMTGTVAVSPTFGLWSPTLTLAVAKQWLATDTQYGTERFNQPIFMCSFSNILDFGKGWKAFVDMQFTSKGDNENCHLSRSTFGLDLRIYKYLMDNRFSLNFGVTNLLDTQKSGNVLHMRNLKTTQIEWKDMREASLTLTYRFNSSKDRYKGTGAGKLEQRRL